MTPNFYPEQMIKVVRLISHVGMNFLSWTKSVGELDFLTVRFGVFPAVQIFIFR